MLTMSASIAKIVIAPVLAIIAHTYGWRAVFLSLAGMGLVWLAFWLPTWSLGPYGGEAAKAATHTDADNEPSVPWVKVLTSGTFIGGWLATMPVYAIVAAILTFLPSYFEKGLGFTRVQAGSMFGFPSIAGIIALLAMTSFSDRLISRGASSRMMRGIVPTIGLALSSVALITLPFISEKYVAVAWISIGYALGVTVLPLFNAGLSEIVPPKQFAATIGIFLALQSLGGIYGPFVAGVIVKHAGNALAGYPLAFQAFGAMSLIGAVIALICVNPERDMARLRGIASDRLRAFHFGPWQPSRNSQDATSGRHTGRNFQPPARQAAASRLGWHARPDLCGQIGSRGRRTADRDCRLRARPCTCAGTNCPAGAKLAFADAC